MFNAYAIIIGFFILGGLVTMAWGWSLIVRARATRRWPDTEGVIEISEPSTQTDDLLPHIVFSYVVDGKTYRRNIEFPAGTLPTPEFSAAYVSKYPPGARLRVHYDPAQPQTATLEPGLGRGDGLLFGLGLAATLLGIIMLLI